MNITNKLEAVMLLVGDLFFFSVSLWVALFLRHFSVPEMILLEKHIGPFAILFAFWVFVFFIMGLYGKHTTLFKRKLPGKILIAQIINTIISALFFFFVSYFQVSPKTVLIIYLAISSLFITVWRLYIFGFLNVGKRSPALLIGGGLEFKELLNEVNSNPRYNINFISNINVDSYKDGGGLSDKIFNELKRSELSVVVVDTKHKKIAGILPHLYKPLYSDVRFVDAGAFYEDVFERLPISSFNDVDSRGIGIEDSNEFYSVVKRFIDIVLSTLFGLVSLIVYPLVAIAIKIEDGGSVFISQERIGERGAIITLYKFRSMTCDDKGGDVLNSKGKVTMVGKILRRFRIDELPQLWNVFRGDISFVGPRPELPSLVEQYTKEIKHYDARHLVAPGLTGWAQIKHDRHPHHGVNVSETINKLSYDLYYVKNKSFLLDILIILQTARVVLTERGS